MNLKLNDKITMKKTHPCGSSVWELLRVGADLRLKCEGCGHMVMLSRSKVEKNIRAINGQPVIKGTTGTSSKEQEQKQ